MREKNNDEKNLFYNADPVRGADRNARHLDEGFEVVDPGAPNLRDRRGIIVKQSTPF